MSVVKRYELGMQPGYYDRPCMEQDETGDYVLHSDYAAVEAERDELARAVVERAWVPKSDRSDRCIDTCKVCGWERRKHRIGKGCPVALAEKIVKGAGDGC